MFYKLQTKKGNISIEKVVIGKIIVLEVNKFGGKVFISAKNGKVIGKIAKIGGLDEKNQIEITMGDSGIDIRMYVVIRFGTSISSTTEKLIKEIKKNIEVLTGITVNSVAIVVTGMISKHLAKRNIEVIG